MNSDLLQIYSLAINSRQWAVNNCFKFGFDDDLEGMCAIASGYLHYLLEAAGIKSHLCINEDHCFLTAKNQLIDITASQFGFNEIVFIPHFSHQADKEIWYPLKTAPTRTKLLEIMIDMRWPKNQLVLTKYKI
jgi:hypothetical protein